MSFITCDGFLFFTFPDSLVQKACKQNPWLNLWRIRQRLVPVSNCIHDKLWSFFQTTLAVDVWRRVVLLKFGWWPWRRRLRYEEELEEEVLTLFKPKVSTAFRKCYLYFVQKASWGLPECYSSALKHVRSRSVRFECLLTSKLRQQSSIFIRRLQY